jgi:hypothetical protein
MSNVAKIIAIMLGCLIVADIIGVIACLVVDVAPLRFKSAPLPYVIWFVLGVFTGLSAYNAAGTWISPDATGDWFEMPGAPQRGTLIVAVAVVVLVALGVLFHMLYWQRGVAGEYFVPDSAPHTIVFFTSVGLSMLLFRWALMPRRKS